MVPSKPMDYALAIMRPERRTSVNRTRTGIVLLIIGLGMGIIYSLIVLASLTQIAGAVLIFAGRKVFDKKYQGYVAWSVLLLVVGVLVGGGVGAWLLISANQSPLSPVDYYTLVAISLLVGNAILGLSLVLFTYALQSQRGKVLLWIGYASTLVLTGSVYWFIIGQAQVGNNPTLDELVIFRLILGTPAIPYSVAYYLGLRHLENKLIPETVSQPPA